jgi:hypothetical protein
LAVEFNVEVMSPLDTGTLGHEGDLSAVAPVRACDQEFEQSAVRLGAFRARHFRGALSNAVSVKQHGKIAADRRQQRNDAGAKNRLVVPNVIEEGLGEK